MYVHTCTYIYIFIYVYTYRYLHTHFHTFTLTHTHIGNTMIEEVTALLMGIATGRAVVFDVRGGGIFGLERPKQCFHRPLALDFEMLLPLFADAEELERRGAARYTLLQCVAEWCIVLQCCSVLQCVAVCCSLSHTCVHQVPKGAQFDALKQRELDCVNMSCHTCE